MSNLFNGMASNPVPQNQDYYMNNNVRWMGPTQNNYMGRTTASQQSIPSIPGRVVFSKDQISPQDIPSTGSPAVFPFSDGSAIIVRAIGIRGNLEEQVYVPMPENQPREEQNDPLNLVMARLDKIEGVLTAALSTPTEPSTKSNTKTKTEAVK